MQQSVMGQRRVDIVIDMREWEGTSRNWLRHRVAGDALDYTCSL